MAKTARTTRSKPTEAPQHRSEPLNASHDSPSSSSPHQPTLPLELVKDILELCWDDGTPEGRAAVISSCSASKAFAGVARELVWKEVRVDCVNAVKSYKEGHADRMASPYSSSSCWGLSPTARSRLETLSCRRDLRDLVRAFEIWPPNGVMRSSEVTMWTTDFGLVQGVVSRLPNITTLALGWIHDPDRLHLQPPAHCDALEALTISRMRIDEEFAKRFPNLRHLYVGSFHLYPHRSATCPPIASLTLHDCGIHLLPLFEVLGPTLVDLTFGNLLAADDFYEWDSDSDSDSDLDSDSNKSIQNERLQELVRLERITVTLRDDYTLRNDKVLQDAIRDDSDGYEELIDRFTETFAILATLSQPQQVTLRFVLPPLAKPKQRRADRRFWRKFFKRLRKSGQWDAMLPKTVKEVDWSGLSKEQQA